MSNQCYKFCTITINQRYDYYKRNLNISSLKKNLTSSQFDDYADLAPSICEKMYSAALHKFNVSIDKLWHYYYAINYASFICS